MDRMALRSFVGGLGRHLIGVEGVEAVLNWRGLTFFAVFQPVLAIVSDICSVAGTPFAGFSIWMLVVCFVLAIAFGALAKTGPFGRRGRYGVLTLVFLAATIVAGIVFLAQKALANGGSVIASEVPEIQKFQMRLIDSLGVVQRGIAESNTRLDAISAKQDADHAILVKLLERSNAKTAPESPLAEVGMSRALAALAQCASTDPRCRKAYEFLKEGKPAEAEPSMLAVAEGKSNSDGKDAAAAFRNLAAIAAVSDPGRAREYYEKAARLDPTNVEGVFQNAWFQQDAGNLGEARAAYDRVIKIAAPERDDDYLIWANFGIGDVLVAQGNLPEALKSFRDGLAIADRLSKSDPGNAGWQRDLSVSYAKLADAFKKSGDQRKALDALRQGWTIMVRMTSHSPDNAVWKRDLDWFDEQIAQATR